VQKTEPKTRFI